MNTLTQETEDQWQQVVADDTVKFCVQNTGTENIYVTANDTIPQSQYGILLQPRDGITDNHITGTIWVRSDKPSIAVVISG